MRRLALCLAALLAGAQPALSQTAPSEDTPAAPSLPQNPAPAASEAADPAMPAGRSDAGAGSLGGAPAAPVATGPLEASEATPGATQEAAADPTRTLNVGLLDDAPPFSSLGRFGVRVGFDVDLVLALCGRLQANCSLHPFAAEDVVAALLDRRIDLAVASLSPTPALGSLVDFTDPYLRIAVRFVVPRETRRDLEGDEDPVYAALAGSAQAEDLTRLYPRPGAVRLYADAEEMWVDLALGRLTGVLAPAVAARRDFLSTPIGEPFRFASVAGGEVRPLAAAIAVRRGEGALRRELNGAIADLLAAPEYGEILSRHLDGDLAGPPPQGS